MLPVPLLTPANYKSNRRHLYAEITWMGFAFAMEWYYLNVYAIRLGATALQLAVLTSARALLMVVGAGLAQRWQRRFPGPIAALMGPLVSARMALYLGIVFVPFLPAHQVDALVAMVLLSAVPTGIAQGVFLGMLPRAVPKEALGEVVARRAVLLNVGILPCILFLSQFLNWFPQPVNYQVGFFISFLVSCLSSWNVHHIKTAPTIRVETSAKPVNVWADGRFRRFALITAMTTSGVFMTASLIGLQLVRGLDASDDWISVFGVCEMIAGIIATARLGSFVNKFGNRRLVIVAAFAVTFQTLILALTPTLPPFIFGSLLLGAGWFSINALLYNWLVELFPGEDLSHYASNFQLLVNFSLFIGPFLGTVLISRMSLPSALLIATGVRLLAVVLAWAIKIDALPSSTAVLIEVNETP